MVPVGVVLQDPQPEPGADSKVSSGMRLAMPKARTVGKLHGECGDLLIDVGRQRHAEDSHVFLSEGLWEDGG